MAKFLLEIGTEELPARFLQNEQADLSRLMAEALAEAHLAHGQISTYATPRRLALTVDDVAPLQEEKEEIVTGPPVRIAYDDGGKPTRALEGFVRTNDMRLTDVFVTRTPKGEYAAVRKRTGGQPAARILAEICPSVLGRIPFPKSMRWGDYGLSYARPVRWVAALLDGEVVDFEFGPLHSGRQTVGHRIHGPGAHDIPDAESYRRTLEDLAHVMADPAERREAIVRSGNDLAAGVGGEVIWKDSLLGEVTGLVEYPVAMLGEFDASYLEIPEEVLLTSMESHQKSFGIRGSDGRLLPYFLTVLNLQPKDMELVRRGWQRVLRARLEDARFFWQTDLASTFAEWLRKLDNVIFIGPLGSMGDKGRRLARLCQWIALHLNCPMDANILARAGELAKADLVSSMVGEFDTLQGVMGGIYALRAGENTEVGAAIAEQYLPSGPDTPLPQTLLGSILSMADKADTLAGCFGLGLIPTGAADSNGLRRCALGIVRIILAQNFRIDIRQLFGEAARLYGDRKWKLEPAEAQEKLVAFFVGRLRNYFIGQGYDTVLVDAVLATNYTDPVDCRDRLEAMTAFAAEPDYEKAVQTLKRVENIGKKAGNHEKGQTWEDSLLVDEAEKELAQTLSTILPVIDERLQNLDYPAVLAKLNELRQPVEKFFENVLVMSDDEKLKANRLKMLDAVSSRFGRVARFAALQI